MSARRSHTVLACAAALVAVVAVGACFSLNLAGHPCNDKHGCVDGFTCVSDVCLASGTAAVDADAGTARDAGNDAGNDDDDAGVTDAGIVDAGFVDGGFVDGGAPSDAGFVDAGDVDAGPGPDVDAGFVDAGPPAVCGDGVADELEECDDGNVLAGDGCSSSCTTEVGFACFGSPSVCCAATRVRRVPADFATIGQAAINAGSGGCVFVSAGDYAGPTLQTDISLVGAGAPTLHNDAQGGNNNPTLSVSHRLLLQGFGVSTSSENASAIVISSGGLLTMRDDDVGPAGKLCVDESGFEASINVTRSVFHGCAGGALRLRGAGTCSVASSFVVGNGGTSSGLAPLQVQRACTLTSLTVANNVANSSNAGALGVDCSNGGGGTTLTRSIVWGNTSIFTGVSQSGEIRTCTTSFDDFEGATGGAGATNIALDPVFVGGGDVHLAPTSPCIDAITDSDHSVDIDGQLRPLGAGDDIGADEAR